LFIGGALQQTVCLRVISQQEAAFIALSRRRGVILDNLAARPLCRDFVSFAACVDLRTSTGIVDDGP
jgi:hypothetical protein